MIMEWTVVLYKVSTASLSLDMEQRATKAKLCTAHAADGSTLLTSEITKGMLQTFEACPELATASSVARFGRHSRAFPLELHFYGEERIGDVTAQPIAKVWRTAIQDPQCAGEVF